LAVLLFVAYVLVTLITAISTKRAVDSISETNIGATLSSGGSGIDDLTEKLAVFNRRFSLLKFWVAPARYTARMLILVPSLDSQREAGELLLERIEIGNDAGSAAIELAGSSFALRESTIGSSISLSDSDDLAGLNEALGKLKSDAFEVLEHLERSSIVEAEFENLDPNSAFTSLNQQLTDQEVRLGQIAEFSRLLVSVLVSDIALMQDMNGSFDDLKKFADGEVSADQISLVISGLARQSKFAREESERMLDSAPSAVLTSEFGDLVGTLYDLNVASDGLIGSLDTIMSTLAASFSTLASSDESLFSGGTAMTETLTALIDNEDEIASAVVAIGDNAAALIELGESSPISLGSLGDVLEGQLEPILDLSSSLAGAPRVLGEIFGIDGETRRYLVLGQTSDELRAAGGFTSSAWLITFDSGRMVENEYINIVTIEDLDSLADYPIAHEALRLHMNAGRMYMRDVGWDPNFPTVGRLAADLYEINRDVTVDGIISVTQWSFVDLVSALGSIEIESRNVGGDEILSTIVAGTDDAGTGFLSSVFKSLLASMTGEALSTKSIDVISTLSSLFESKDLMIFSTDSEIQSLIEDIGWGGALSSARDDRLAIVDSNVGWNKVDGQIDRKYSYRVNLSDLDQPKAELRLEYSNNSEGGSDSCAVQIHVGGLYRDLVNGCYWNYLRIYVANGAELSSSESMPLEAGSIASRVGLLSAGSETVHLLPDDNGLYISGLMALPPQETRDLRFDIDLPTQVLRREPGIVEYLLRVSVQAGTRGRTGTVTVLLPEGYDVVDAGDSVQIDQNIVEFTVHPGQDDVIRLTLKQTS